MKRAFLSVCILAGVFSLSGCGGENSKFDLTRPIESSLDIALDGLFTGPDDMTVEFDGDEGVLIDYGDSIYGTNPVVIALGSPLIQDIRCDTVSCDGLYGVPQVSNGVVGSVRWESVTLTPTEDGGIAIESASLGELVFEPKKEPEEENEENPTSTKNLTYDASCKEWWDALSNSGEGRIWKQISWGDELLIPDDPSQPYTYIDQGLMDDDSFTTEYKFFGVNQYSERTIEMGSENPITDWTEQRDVTLSDNAFGSGHCQFWMNDERSELDDHFYPHLLESGILKTVFPYSEKGGEISHFTQVYKLQ